MADDWPGGGRGPDREPLVVMAEVIGRLDEAVVRQAHTLYNARFEVGNDST